MYMLSWWYELIGVHAVTCVHNFWLRHAVSCVIVPDNDAWHKKFAGFSCPITGNIHQHHHSHAESRLLLQQQIQMSLTCDAALQGQENEGTSPDPGPWPQEICLRDCVCSSQQRRQHPPRSLLLHRVAHSTPEAAESVWGHSMACRQLGCNVSLQIKRQHWYCRCQDMSMPNLPKQVAKACKILSWMIVGCPGDAPKPIGRRCADLWAPESVMHRVSCSTQLGVLPDSSTSDQICCTLSSELSCNSCLLMAQCMITACTSRHQAYLSSIKEAPAQRMRCSIWCDLVIFEDPHCCSGSSNLKLPGRFPIQIPAIICMELFMVVIRVL